MADRNILYKLLPAIQGGRVANASDIEITSNNIANVTSGDWALDALESLQTQITTNRQAQNIARGSFDTFNDSFNIDDTNAAVNWWRVNIYAAKIDKIVEVTLPTTAQLTTANIGYPYGVEFVHSAWSVRLTANNILRIDAWSSQTGDLIDQPILQNPGVPSTRVQMFQGDIGLFVKDDAASNYRYLQGVFDPIAEITRQWVFAFRNDHVITDIDDIETDLNNVTINQWDAFLVQVWGTRFGYNISDGDVVLAKVNNPSLASNSDDWLHFADSSQALTSDQMAFFWNIERDWTEFTLSRNVVVDAQNVSGFNSMASWSFPINYPYFTTSRDDGVTARTATFTNQNIQFTDLIWWNLQLIINFAESSSSGFLPELTNIEFDYGGGNVFTFPLIGVWVDSWSNNLNITIANADYSWVLNTNCDITLNYQFRGASFVWVFSIQWLVNSKNWSLNQSVSDIAQREVQAAEIRLENKIDLITRDVNEADASISALLPRVSPYRNNQVVTPEVNAYFGQSTWNDAFPTSLSGLSQTSADNPRFTVTWTAAFIVAPAVGSYTLKNITQDTVTALNSSEATVDLWASISANNQTYFVYRVTGFTANNVIEIENVRLEQVVAWQDDINDLKWDVERIDTELTHAAINLEDELINVLNNEVVVNEESTPNEVASSYNLWLSTGGTQKIYRESTNIPASWGIKNSNAISWNSWNDRYRNKLLYIPWDVTYWNSTIVTAFDWSSTNTDLIQYTNGEFIAKVFVPAKSASTSTETIYPAPATRVSWDWIWQTLETLTFQNGVPVNEANELFFTRNVPTASTTLNINYRWHANGNIFGTASTTLAGVWGSSDVSTSVTVNDWSETVIIEILYRATTRDIRVSVTDRVNVGLPTIQDVQVILSYTESRTIPATAATTRDVTFESQATDGRYNVFWFKADSSWNLILVWNEREINTWYAYTTIFWASEWGHISTTFDVAQYFDFENLGVTNTTIRDLENHSVLPLLDLFETQYTHNTVVEFDTWLQAKNSQGDDVRLWQELVLVASNNTRWRLSVDTSWNLSTAQIT